MRLCVSCALSHLDLGKKIELGVRPIVSIIRRVGGGRGECGGEREVGRQRSGTRGCKAGLTAHGGGWGAPPVRGMVRSEEGVGIMRGEG